LDESVQMDTPPRSPPEPPPDEELLEMVGAAPVPTQLKERPEMTARQRWHWAYNQIIMQLNVRKIRTLFKIRVKETCSRLVIRIYEYDTIRGMAMDIKARGNKLHLLSFAFAKVTLLAK